MLLVGLTLLGCTPDPDVTASGPANPLDAGWIPQVVDNPQVFSRLMEQSDRAGWIAYHKGDYATASKSLEGIARWRAQSDHAAFE